MPDPKQSTQAAVKAAAPSASPLGPAGESGDPAVHKLLADLETARSNGDGDAVKAARDALAALGFSS
jgi:hypothetical protein